MNEIISPKGIWNWFDRSTNQLYIVDMDVLNCRQATNEELRDFYKTAPSDIIKGKYENVSYCQDKERGFKSCVGI